MFPESSRIVVRSAVLTVATAFLMTGGGLILSGCNFFYPPKPEEGQMKATTPVQSDVVAVFFSKYQGNHSIVEDVSRKLPDANKQEPLKFALTELLKGPSPEEKSQGFYSEIPAGTKLLGVNQDQKNTTVDLSRQFATGGGSTSMTQRLEELKRTVKAVDSKHPVKIAVEGKPLETLGGEGLEVPGTMQSESQ